MDHETMKHIALAVGPVAVKYVFDAFVGALETPDEQSSKLYRFCFRFFNLLAANIKRSQLASNGNGNGAANGASAGK